MLQFINDHKEIIIGVIVISATIFTAGHIIGYAAALYEIQSKVITLNASMNKLDNEYNEILLKLFPTEVNKSTAAYAQFYDIATQITDCGVQVVSLITT